jgi:hypothetical protein
MPTPLDEYKAFIDALVRIRPDVLTQWIKQTGWPNSLENERFNQHRVELTPEQLAVVAEIGQQGRDGGIHDVLLYLADEINLKRLRLVRNGVEFPIEPYGTELYWDWDARLSGREWPERSEP